MRLRCAIVNNMNSGKNKRYRYNRDKFMSFVPDTWRIIDSYSLSDLPPAIHLIKEEGINLLMINGGDGTLQRIITELIQGMPENSLPIILPLRGGTANMVAGNIGVRKNPLDTVRILAKYVDDYGKGRETMQVLPVMPLKVTDRNNGIKYGFAFMNGLIYKVQDLFTKQENPTFSTVVNLITTTIGGYAIANPKIRKYYSKISADVSIDGTRYPEDRYLLMIAAVFQRLLLWFRPFYSPDAKGVNKFYFAATASDPWILIRNIRAFTTGKQVPPRTFNSPAGQVQIKAECGYALDGELVRDRYTDITIGQGPMLRFFVVPDVIRTSYGITYRAYINPSHISTHLPDNIAPFGRLGLQI
ncbi:MAG: hypothetical protein M1491_07140 [Deltaproteobacteria bacterium]|nr:hypothetical protein [Deltaproteobacteria bacterium]MCL5276744.1 hypothetical protein [Deltaproteobacteria bacterium]